MRTLFSQVRQFMKLAGQPILNRPGVPSASNARLGLDLIREEWEELQKAVHVVDRLQEESSEEDLVEALAEVADALGDLLYVVTWNGLAWGLPMPDIMQEIQQANLDKFGPGSRKLENGKVAKPPGWTPPDIARVIRRDRLVRKP